MGMVYRRMIFDGRPYTRRTPPCQRAVESLDLWSANRALPTLRLHVDRLEAELVERNNSVEACVTGMAHALKVLLVRTVTQSVQQLEHQPFEEHGCHLHDPFKELLSDRATNLL